MKKFMTMSAFFLSAACLSVHTPSFANGFFDDISRGAEKASRGLMNTGSSQPHRHHRATNDETMPSQSSQAPDGTNPYGQFITPTTPQSVTAQDPLLAPTTESPAEPTPASNTTPSQSVTQEQNVTATPKPSTPQSSNRPPDPTQSYMTQQ